MNRESLFKVLSLILLITTLSLFLGNQSPLLAKDTKTRFAYKVLPLDYDDFKSTPQWRATRAKHGDDWKATPAFYELVLNTLAKDGWELVNLQTRNNKSTLLYLKKRLD